ncbi:BA14K family protein [Aureimonas sp. SK2]|uniref:BA14K family protein n=1 Tax=Aureimonas sp. SK2 TaxID=3015992 RepID=UPI0024448EFE|nr:BA14K family protein [Aureimonas sp. SK2]
MRKTLLALVTSAVALTAAVPAAQADPWRRHHRGVDAGDVLLGGAVGLAAGALLGSALSQPRQPEYYAPAPRYYEPPPRPVYVAPPSYEDTIPAPPRYRQPRQARYYDDYGTYSRSSHVERCLARYRSYDPRTDTYVGYDGYERRCNL